LRAIRDAEDLARQTKALIEVAPAFGPVAERVGPLPLRRLPTGYEGLAGIVVSQMVSRASADAIWGRLRAHLGIVAPEAVLSVSHETLCGLGLSGAKARTLRGLADACEAGLDLHAVAGMPAPDAIAAMTALKGVGLWTAEVYLLFAAGHPDIFPSGDVALRTAAGTVFDLGPRPTDRAVRALAADWAPHRAIAARLLWADYARAARRDAVPVI
jgi:DNA-3-methyladenine glycosylase II